MNFKAVLASSEFWMSIVALLGTIAVNSGVIPKEQWDTLVVPLGVYIVGRITSKVAKSVSNKGAK